MNTQSTLFADTPAVIARETRVCTRCNGTKACTIGGYVHEGVTYPERSYKCTNCNGVGAFEAPDIGQIVSDIAGRKGLCSKRPTAHRSYYVWRMARFWGGVDVTMPMGAMTELGRDPYVKELDVLADQVAKKVYGTNVAAAYRWAPLLVGEIPIPKNLPATAYPCGPVATEEKPECELLELR